eukprot:tig00001229_g7850.t1
MPAPPPPDDAGPAAEKPAWRVKASDRALATQNKIRSHASASRREVLEGMDVRPNPEKPTIPLSIGDPTAFGNLVVPDAVTELLVKRARSATANGYLQSTGDQRARAAVAKRHSRLSSPLTAADVILTSGCSHALDLAISVLANAGQNILIPKPSFPLYQTICTHYAIQCRFYRLLPHQNWEIDLAHLASLVDEHTSAIVLNNPSNPCGSVYSREHLLDLLAVAESLRIPIISDEIYADMVFQGSVFHPLASLSVNVPILAVGGLAKQFIVPGWRMGWICIHDRHQAFQQIREGLARLSGLILGPCSLIQAVLPEIFDLNLSEFFRETVATLQRNAMFLEEKLSSINGLRVVPCQGTMYLMLEIDFQKLDGICDDRQTVFWP